MESAEGNLLLSLPDNCWPLVVCRLSNGQCAALRQTCKAVQRSVDAHLTRIAVWLILEGEPAEQTGHGGRAPKGVLSGLRRLLQRFQERDHHSKLVQPQRMIQQPGKLQHWPALATLSITICCAHGAGAVGPKLPATALKPAQHSAYNIPSSGLSSVFLGTGRMLTALRITSTPLTLNPRAWMATTDALCSVAAGCPSLVVLELSSWKLSTTSFAPLAAIQPLRVLRLDAGGRHGPKLVAASGDFMEYDLSWLAACASIGVIKQLERLEVGAPVCWSQSTAAAWAGLSRLTALRIGCLGPEGNGGHLCTAPLPVSPERTAELLVSYPNWLYGFDTDPSLTTCGQHLRNTLQACGPALTGLHVVWPCEFNMQGILSEPPVTSRLTHLRALTCPNSLLVPPTPAAIPQHAAAAPGASPPAPPLCFPAGLVKLRLVGGRGSQWSQQLPQLLQQLSSGAAPALRCLHLDGHSPRSVLEAATGDALAAVSDFLCARPGGRLEWTGAGVSLDEDGAEQKAAQHAQQMGALRALRRLATAARLTVGLGGRATIPSDIAKAHKWAGEMAACLTRVTELDVKVTYLLRYADCTGGAAAGRTPPALPEPGVAAVEAAAAAKPSPPAAAAAAAAPPSAAQDLGPPALLQALDALAARGRGAVLASLERLTYEVQAAPADPIAALFAAKRGLPLPAPPFTQQEVVDAVVRMVAAAPRPLQSVCCPNLAPEEGSQGQQLGYTPTGAGAGAAAPAPAADAMAAPLRQVAAAVREAGWPATAAILHARPCEVWPDASRWHDANAAWPDVG